MAKRIKHKPPLINELGKSYDGVDLLHVPYVRPPNVERLINGIEQRHAVKPEFSANTTTTFIDGAIIANAAVVHKEGN